MSESESPETFVNPAFDETTVAAVKSLHERYPDTPFLTLGQTVFWDEPVKAIFCRLLETVAPEAQMMAAVHDTDYFAKLPREARESDSRFVLLPHNDGSTRSLWSAAGELSSLFGSETVPTRGQLAEHGVAFDRVARRYPGGAAALLEHETNAPGWRALVHTEPSPLIAADVRLGDIASDLRRQLEWGFAESLRILGNRDSAVTVAQTIRGWIDAFLEANPDDTLTSLYRALTPKLWGLVRSGGTCNLLNSASTELFRFNRDTCSLPRFRFVDLFLQPDTRDTARRCYNEALHGSGIYTLDAFGEGALPFDVVLRGRGRGTLRYHGNILTIDTDEPITVSSNCQIGSVAELAEALEKKFGPDVVLVGKAVALISMLSAEFIFVFHRKASSYTARTQEMNECLRRNGIALDLKPMLRLTYATWDALEGVDANFTLPAYLANAFKTPTISATEFAAHWEKVCDEQDALVKTLANCHAPRDLISHLAQTPPLFSDESSRVSVFGEPLPDVDEPDWGKLLAEYDSARASIREIRGRTQTLQQEAEAWYGKARAAALCAAEIERSKGEDWRNRVQPLRTRLSDIRQGADARLVQAGSGPNGKLTKEEKAERSAIEAQEARELEELRARIAEFVADRCHFDRKIAEQNQISCDFRDAGRAKTRERVALESGPQMKAARESIAQIEYRAELERLRRTRDALITSQGLRYINYRPTAWWFPLVSPDGHWFHGLSRTAKATIEDL